MESLSLDSFLGKMDHIIPGSGGLSKRQMTSGPAKCLALGRYSAAHVDFMSLRGGTGMQLESPLCDWERTG